MEYKKFHFSIIKNFFICSFGSLILRCITASIGIVTLRYITPADYSLLSLLNNFIAIVPIFLNLGLRQAFGLDFFHKNSYERSRMVQEIIWIYLTLAIPIFLLSLFFIQSINQIIFYGFASTVLLLIALICCFIHFFTELLLQVLRYQSKAFSLTMLQLCMTATTVVTTLLLVYFLRLSIMGMMLANLAGMLICLCYGGLQYYKKIRLSLWQLRPSFTVYAYYLNLGLPFVPSIIFWWILASGNRWFLASLSTMHNVGIYSLADTFVQLFQLLVLGPLSVSYVPYIFEQFANNKHAIGTIDAWNHRIMYACMFIGSALITVGFFCFRPILYSILPPTYYEAIHYIYPMLIGQIFLLGSYFALCYIQFFKHNYLMVLFVVIAASTSCLLNRILIPYLHIYGCVIAMTISYALYFLLIIATTAFIKKQKKLVS